MTLSRGVPCSCLGSNVNCCRCFGSGVIDRRSLPAAPPHRVSATTTLSPSGKQVKCPNCASLMPADDLDMHLSEHRRAKQAAREKSRRKRRNKAVVGVPPAKDRTLKECPECRNMVRASRLDRHRRKVHRVITHDEPAANDEISQTDWNRVPRSLPSTRRRSDAFSKCKSSAERNERTIERRLDASRDYYRFRENGRFGSHSVHDDFGDESSS